MDDKKSLLLQAKAPTRREMLGGAAVALGALALGSVTAWAKPGDEISHSAESIHQEVSFKASRKRVYDALTDARQFIKVMQLSAAVTSGMALGSSPAEISRVAGGAFSIFAGHVVGRQIELVPNERIVQAWRVVDWSPGTYSLAKFVLAEEGSGTELIFDHTGFPSGQAEHLAAGWKGNYWEPLEKFLTQP